MIYIYIYIYIYRGGERENKELLGEEPGQQEWNQLSEVAPAVGKVVGGGGGAQGNHVYY